jgi:hypothetical protein
MAISQSMWEPVMCHCCTVKWCKSLNVLLVIWSDCTKTMCKSSSVNISEKQSKDKESELMWGSAQPFTPALGALNWCIWAPSSLVSWDHNWYIGTLLSKYSDKSATGVFELRLHFYHDATTDLSEHSCQNILINHQLVYLRFVCTSIMTLHSCQNTSQNILINHELVYLRSVFTSITTPQLMSEHYCQNILINQLVYLSSICTSIMMPQLICQNTIVRIFW